MLSRLKPHGSIRRDIIEPFLLRRLLSAEFLRFRRKCARLLSKLKGHTQPSLDILVSGDDAHSYVLLQCMQKLLQKYPVRATVAVLPPAINGWATSFDVKTKWAVRDAALLAALYGLKEPSLNSANSSSINMVTRRMLAGAQAVQGVDDSSKNTIDRTLMAMSTIWDGSEKNDVFAEKSLGDHTILKRNTDYLKKLGFYNPGAVHFQGEFYPPNRLHHLEARLQEDFNLGLSVKTSSEDGRSFLFDQEIACERNVNYEQMVATSDAHRDRSIFRKKAVELFYSFRSPYSQLILSRLKRLCTHFGREIVLRPVLPMVSRGLKVPLEKQIYIVTDAAREARLWGIPFGNMVDPLHPNKMPYLRAFDAYSVALKYGKEFEFVESYGVCQWGHGISAGTDEGLKKMLCMANMNENWEELREIIYCETDDEKFLKWEGRTAGNRDCLISRGLWGVPSVKYGDVMVFGQDKLWTLAAILQNEEAIPNKRSEERSAEYTHIVSAISKYCTSV